MAKRSTNRVAPLLLFAAIVGCGNVASDRGPEAEVEPDADVPNDAGGLVCSQRIAKSFAKRFGAGNGGVGFNVSVAPDGSIYLAGAGELDLPRCGDAPSYGVGLAFVARLDGAGNVIWERRVDVYPTDSRRMRLDARNGHGVTFAFEVSAGADLGSGPLPAGIAFGRLDEQGQLVFARHAAQVSVPVGLGVGSDGSIALAGRCPGALEMDGVALCGTDRDAFLLRSDASGKLTAARTFSGDPDALMQPVAVVDATLAPDGDVIVAGELRGPADLGAGVVDPDVTPSSDLFIARYDSTLAYRKHVILPAIGNFLYLDAAPDGDVVLAASYSVPEIGGVKLPYGVAANLLVARLDSELEHVYTRGFASSEPDLPESLRVDWNGNAVVATRAGGGMDIDGVVTTQTGHAFIELDAAGAVARVEPIGVEFLSDVAPAPEGARVLVGGLNRQHEPLDLGNGPLEVVGQADGFIVKLGP